MGPPKKTSKMFSALLLSAVVAVSAYEKEFYCNDWQVNPGLANPNWAATGEVQVVQTSDYQVQAALHNFIGINPSNALFNIESRLYTLPCSNTPPGGDATNVWDADVNSPADATNQLRIDGEYDFDAPRPLNLVTEQICGRFDDDGDNVPRSWVVFNAGNGNRAFCCDLVEKSSSSSSSSSDSSSSADCSAFAPSSSTSSSSSD